MKTDANDKTGKVLLVYEDTHNYNAMRAKPFPSKQAAIDFTKDEDFCLGGERAFFLIVTGTFDWEEDCVDLT